MADADGKEEEERGGESEGGRGAKPGGGGGGRGAKPGGGRRAAKAEREELEGKEDAGGARGEGKAGVGGRGEGEKGREEEKEDEAKEEIEEEDKATEEGRRRGGKVKGREEEEAEREAKPESEKGKRREPGDKAEATVATAEGATLTPCNWSVPRETLIVIPTLEVMGPPQMRKPRTIYIRYTHRHSMGGGRSTKLSAAPHQGIPSSAPQKA